MTEQERLELEQLKQRQRELLEQTSSLSHDIERLEQRLVKPVSVVTPAPQLIVVPTPQPAPIVTPVAPLPPPPAPPQIPAVPPRHPGPPDVDGLLLVGGGLGALIFGLETIGRGAVPGPLPEAGLPPPAIVVMMGDDRTADMAVPTQ